MTTIIDQSGFYSAVSKSQCATEVRRFRQLGTGGYLPRGGEGACSFTTLDFHRAAEQGTLSEWCAQAGQNPGGQVSDLLSSTVTNFGARQQHRYSHMGEAHSDPLFTRTNRDLSHENYENVVLDSRTPIIPSLENNERFPDDRFHPAAISSVIQNHLGEDGSSAAMMRQQNPHFIRMTFALKSKDGSKTGEHTVGIYQSGSDTSKILFMDPNAGVFSVPKTQLTPFLSTYQSTLYKDYNLSAVQFEDQAPFWNSGRIYDEKLKEEFRITETRGHQVAPDGYTSYIEFQKKDAENQRDEVAKAPDCNFSDDDQDDDVAAASSGPLLSAPKDSNSIAATASVSAIVSAVGKHAVVAHDVKNEQQSSSKSFHS